MQSNKFHTSKQSHFHPFLQLLGQLAYSDLKYQIEYLKIENEILRSKCSKRIRLNDSEKRRIIKFALPLGPNIRKFISVVNYTTYRRWLKKQNDISNPSPRIGRPRKTTEEIITIIIHMVKKYKSRLHSLAGRA